MLWFADAFEAIRDFMVLGGPVLKVIALTILLMWVVIIERIMYFRTSMGQMSKEIHDNWESRPERRSWNALRHPSRRRSSNAMCRAKRRTTLGCLRMVGSG